MFSDIGRIWPSQKKKKKLIGNESINIGYKMMEHEAVIDFMKENHTFFCVLS